MKITKGFALGVLILGLAGMIGCSGQPQQSEKPNQKQEQTQPSQTDGKLTFSDPRLERISQKFHTKYDQNELSRENVAKVDLMDGKFEYNNGTIYKPDDLGLYSMIGYQVDKEKEVYDWQKDDLVAMLILEGGNGKKTHAIELFDEAKARTTDQDVISVLNDLQKEMKDLPDNTIIRYHSQSEDDAYPVLKKYRELEMALQKEMFEKLQKK
ncbi:hypothetical protein JQN58_01935 [Aneurinibacillus sp. BA2021]|nr:hypothetical protein [Aneurinibacillus sp. BA2021]